MTRARILVAGIGNVFMGDDAFGCEVARRLAERGLPTQVRVVDFGIRGFDLAYSLLDGYDLTILVDAMPRGGPPGTLYAIDPGVDRWDGLAGDTQTIDMHGMNPAKVLALVKSMGGDLRRMVVVGCEPSELNPDDEERLGLSAPVSASVDEAVSMIETIIQRALQD